MVPRFRGAGKLLRVEASADGSFLIAVRCNTPLKSFSIVSALPPHDVGASQHI